MLMSPRHVEMLLAQGGPRYYFQCAAAHLDHPLWSAKGVRFLVQLDVRGASAADSATEILDNIEGFRSAYQSANPGKPFPGYGVYFAALGGWYAWEDYAGYVPFASHHPDDSLPQFVNAFTFTKSGHVTGVVDGTPTPTTTSFKISGGTAFGRPDGGLVNNSVTFQGNVTPGLAGVTRRVTGWAGNTVTMAADPTGTIPAPQADDTCTFETLDPPACYWFANAREAMLAWAEEFFDEVDTLWPADLPRPEHVACTTENLGEPSVAWFGNARSLVPYADADLALTSGSRPLLTDSLTLTDWLAANGNDLHGAAIPLSGPAFVAPRSPEAQDIRSLSYGAFVVGLAWTWQLSFVNRMKLTWPGLTFFQYQLASGSRRSPTRTQPGEVFYHGDPWPPDIGHCHDEYNWILDLIPCTIAYGGLVAGAAGSTVFVASSGTVFPGSEAWGQWYANQLRFDPETPTTGLRNRLETILSWVNAGMSITCTDLGATPAAGDKFNAYVLLGPFAEWKFQGVGWAVWPAWRALYGHTGDLAEVYRQTCISWAKEAAECLCAAWPNHDVAPFVARLPEDLLEQALPDTLMFPDPRLEAPPGLQSRADWTRILINMLDAGISRIHVFEGSPPSTTTLDAWLEIFDGVRLHYDTNIQNYQAIAPHPRNRDWRNRRLWRN